MKILLMLLLFFSTTAPHAEKMTVKAGNSFFTVIEVFDGDTVLLNDGRKVRLLGINTPEIQHPDRAAEAGGEEAKQWLTDKLKNTRVRLETDIEKTDHYGRTLAHLFTENKEHLNVSLVAAGLAQVTIWPPNLKYVTELVNAERQAETARFGIWRRPEYVAIPVNQLDDSENSGWTRVVGKIRAINSSKKFVYLEFTDHFNARIDMEWLSLFPDLKSYLGKTVEVRGWLNKRGDTFSMLIRHPSAIK